MKIRQILESMTAGGTGTGAIATAPGKLGKTIKRQGNLLADEGSMPPSPKPQWSKEQAAKKQHNQKELKKAQFLKKKAEQPPTKGMSNAEKADKGWRNPNLKEGSSDYVGNAIEDLRASKPGLDRESFLDELYSYLDAQYGKRVADAAFASEDDVMFDEWYDSYTDMMEVSLGDYRKKAGMQKAQAGMGAMFGRSPEERARELATFKKRERGLERVKARDEKARKAEQDKQLADLVARLPELKAEYERMRAEYKSLGGSDWQYADREQNLTDYERKARSMEGPMNNLWRQIQAAEKAQGQQGVAEDKQKGVDGKACWKGYKRMGTKQKGGKTVDNCVPMESTVDENKKGVRAVKHTSKPKGIDAPKPRNFVAKNAKMGGAGQHKDKKKAAKQGDVKHKAKELAYESKLWAALERKIVK